MVCKFIKFCLAIGICASPYVHCSPTSSLMDKIKELQEFVVTITNISTLEYGDICHSDEIKITETAEKGLESILKIDDSSLEFLESELDKVNEAVGAFLSSGHKICNGRKLLRCDESTNLCKCGPKSLSDRDFSYIQGANGECYWAKDTPCFPTDNHLGQFTNRCANNTKCAFTNEVGVDFDCEYTNIQKYLTVNADEIIQKCNCIGELEVLIKQDNAMGDGKSLSHSTSSANAKYVNVFLYNLVTIVVLVHTCFEFYKL